jgi:hypothetical protein
MLMHTIELSSAARMGGDLSVVVLEGTASDSKSGGGCSAIHAEVLNAL